MAVSRVVPDLESASLEEAKAFYTHVLGMEVVMDLGWIVTLADPEGPNVQLSIMTHDATAPVVPAVSVQSTMSTRVTAPPGPPVRRSSTS
jgi:catechol 2,3-dioxygenase-like lactoylglutathione lyase family enzyme